jgi:hypothetical protein
VIKLLWMVGFVTAGLFAQDNAAVLPGRSMPLGLENMFRSSKQDGVPSIDLFSQDPWVANASARITPTQSFSHSEPAGVCSVPLVEMAIPKDKNFTMIQMTPNSLIDSKMVVKPPVSACVVEPAAKSH